MDPLEQYNNYNQAMDWLHTGKIIFVIIAAVGLIMILYGFFRNMNGAKRRGAYIFILSAIVAVCLHLVEGRTKKDAFEYIDTYNVYE
ncbi:hypothetical protein [Dysgonomonas sp. 520]|uniref:hypothetical protein n=1 Tax=Dysgonomonas sp. 520 TaxID=2302931 RepID=UPI0013D1A721|nr:hypothetical protein [Dysgonomonas sp. 520]NDW08158.1 hypothetical protein [Dysgonomonas sp. 520]